MKAMVLRQIGQPLQMEERPAGLHPPKWMPVDHRQDELKGCRAWRGQCDRASCDAYAALSGHSG